MPSKLQFILSVLAHVIVVVVLFVPPAMEERREQPQAGADPSPITIALTDTESVDEEFVANPDPLRLPEEAGRVDYAGAPQPPGAERSDQPTAHEPIEKVREMPDRPTEALDNAVALNEPPQSSESQWQPDPADNVVAESTRSAPVATAASPPEEVPEYLVASDSLRPDGMRSPSFQFEGVGFSELELIARTKQGIVAAFSGDNVFAVHGVPTDPQAVTLVSSDQLARFSLRAIDLQRADFAKVLTELRLQFATPADSVQIRLLISNAVDALILQRQREAAQRYRLALEDVRATIGRPRFRNGQITDYEIRCLVLTDGQLVSVASRPPRAVNQHDSTP